MTTINTTGKTFNNYLNKFILEEAKKEGRKRKLDEMKKKVESQDNNFAVLTDYTSISTSSGGIAKHNIYEIEEALLRKVEEREHNAEQKKQRVSVTKETRQQKSNLRFKLAFTKYTSGKALTREDLVALINKTKQPTDTATGKNVRELTAQWNVRKERLDDYLPIKNEVATELCDEPKQGQQVLHPFQGEVYLDDVGETSSL
jgi:hypothetical protein